MLPLAHLGFGTSIGQRLWAKKTRFTFWTFCLGTLLPDLIDKSLYYLLKPIGPFPAIGLSLDWVTGTRTVAHTLLFPLLLTGVLTTLFPKATLGRNALIGGILTHLLLDGLSEQWIEGSQTPHQALLWPLLGWDFPHAHYDSLREHWLRKLKLPFILGELAGAYFWWRQIKIFRKTLANFHSTLC
jgi:hypothetical protein